MFTTTWPTWRSRPPAVRREEEPGGGVASREEDEGLSAGGGLDEEEEDSASFSLWGQEGNVGAGGESVSLGVGDVCDVCVLVCACVMCVCVCVPSRLMGRSLFL